MYIIIPTYGNKNLTNRFISNFLESCSDLKIIITDSHPEKVHESLSQEYSFVDVIFPRTNAWWVESINFAIEYLNQKYKPQEYDKIVFANNDVTISTDSVNRLNNILEENPTNLLHPLTKDEKGNIISSGARIITWIPFITAHPKNNSILHLSNARFLMFNYLVLQKVGLISNKLIQYQGDNYFTYKAFKLGYITLLCEESYCVVDESNTGLKKIGRAHV